MAKCKALTESAVKGLNERSQPRIEHTHTHTHTYILQYDRAHCRNETHVAKIVDHDKNHDQSYSATPLPTNWQ